MMMMTDVLDVSSPVSFSFQHEMAQAQLFRHETQRCAQLQRFAQHRYGILYGCAFQYLMRCYLLQVLERYPKPGA